VSVATRTLRGRAPARGAPTPAPAQLLRALVGRGLRDHARAPFTWGLPLGAMAALIVAIWPSIEDSISDAVGSYPEPLKEAFGIGELNDVEAYLQAEMLSLIVPLVLGFFAVRAAARALAGAEERGYLDVVLAAPVSRTLLVAGTFAAIALALIPILLVIAACAWAAGLLAGTDLSLPATVAGLANVWPLALFFAGAALLAAGLTRGSARVTALAAGTLVAMYLIDVLGKISEPIEPIRVVSAFRYYGAAIEDGIDPLAFAGLALAGMLLAAAGAIAFQRRDLIA
jgi:ABC-2 type transport system permease protein